MTPPSNWIKFVIYALAVYRLTHLLVFEDGPFDVFDWLRAKAGVYVAIVTTNPPQEQFTADTFLGRLLLCPLCLSVWVAGVAVIAMWLNLVVCDMIASWLALAGVSVLLFGGERES